MATGGAFDDLYTYDLSAADNGPRRPDVNDLGGEGNTDLDPNPAKGEEPFAGAENEKNRAVAALCRVGGSVKIWIDFSAGLPTVVQVKAMGRAVTPASFTATLIGGAVGKISITWAPYTLPPLEAPPAVTMNDWLCGGGGKLDVSSPNAIEVRTFTNGGTYANHPFVVEIQ